MNKVLAIGETIYDILFRDGQPVAAKAGGSMLNTAVSLGRAGIPVEMITELGDDQVGRLISDFLVQNRVSTSFIQPVPEFKTPVSLAFLDAQGNAKYSFYKKYPQERLNIDWPLINNGDVVLFGSFYSLSKDIRKKLVDFIKKAKEQGALIFYDPNIRKNHLAEIQLLMPLIEENIRLADIVRGSDEDFLNLFGLTDNEAIFNKIQNIGGKCLIITKGNQGVDLLSGTIRLHLDSEKINPVSTIGAGDSFNAGLIYGLMNNGISVEDLVHISPEKWKELLNFGVTFAADVCKGYDNYISEAFRLELHG